MLPEMLPVHIPTDFAYFIHRFNLDSIRITYNAWTKLAYTSLIMARVFILLIGGFFLIVCDETLEHSWLIKGCSTFLILLSIGIIYISLVVGVGFSVTKTKGSYLSVKSFNRGPLTDLPRSTLLKFSWAFDACWYVCRSLRLRFQYSHTCKHYPFLAFSYIFSSDLFFF